MNKPERTNLGFWVAALILVLMPPAFPLALALGCAIAWGENRLYDMALEDWVKQQNSPLED